ncbi:NUDIX domain-containing protein [Marinobacteraceae bacterium S3BR75-40.1]
MPKTSAGVLLYRRGKEDWEILLVHSGGPFWQNRDLHAWSIPKGEVDEGESSLEAAIRELHEETGIRLHDSPWWLGEIIQSRYKRVQVWALAQDHDPEDIHSNLFEMEWPPHSGKLQSFPEVDQAAWYTLDQAEDKLHKGQRQLIALFRSVSAE